MRTSAIMDEKALKEQITYMKESKRQIPARLQKAENEEENNLGKS